MLHDAGAQHANDTRFMQCHPFKKAIWSSPFLKQHQVNRAWPQWASGILLYYMGY